ncbi:glutamate 5-kinase [Shouchella patagoniensis]|uniref:glutamate 5-kinase n=1 Tax=Shouchella patagoniensis TaxID=228576 RepID=UPI000994D59B|nr:glutamate 5-kinase [Shouchella patagoniensis]
MANGIIVIKIGSSSLTDSAGHLNVPQLKNHVQAIVALLKQKYKVVLVTSGAVAAGFPILGYKQKPQSISQKQAAAAVGQSLLMQSYMEAFRKHHYVAAQLLLTRADFTDSTRFSNMSRTIVELLNRGAIPIVNENDSISIDELTFGDNDRLSALVSGIVHADMLCLFTDVNGVYDQNPFKNKDAKKYHYLANIPETLLKEIDSTTSSVGTGGMKSKLLAAKTAIDFGTNVFIGSGCGNAKFTDVLHGKGDGTYLGPFSNKTMSNVKQWIVYHSKPIGSIHIDEGASMALLQKRKSLLPAGVIQAEGPFTAGDIINVFANSKLIGKGKVNFSKNELDLIKGLSSVEAMQVTNRSKKAVIHRNFWVAIEQERLI